MSTEKEIKISLTEFKQLLTKAQELDIRLPNLHQVDYLLENVLLADDGARLHC